MASSRLQHQSGNDQATFPLEYNETRGEDYFGNVFLPDHGRSYCGLVDLRGVRFMRSRIVYGVLYEKRHNHYILLFKVLLHFKSKSKGRSVPCHIAAVSQAR